MFGSRQASQAGVIRAWLRRSTAADRSGGASKSSRSGTGLVNLRDSFAALNQSRVYDASPELPSQALGSRLAVPRPLVLLLEKVLRLIAHRSWLVHLRHERTKMTSAQRAMTPKMSQPISGPSKQDCSTVVPLG